MLLLPILMACEGCMICCDITFAAANFSCADGDIRLLDGNTMYEGRVEVCVNNKFTTVCSGNWDNAEATVVCNQLGFTGPGSEYMHVST